MSRLWIAVWGILIATGTGWAAAADAPAAPATHKYVGVDKCAMCHKSAAKGNQYGQWLATKHAKAWEALASDRALAIAKEKGLTTPPQQNDACVKCHVTGHGKPASAFEASFKKELGIQCEACHGPGKDYMGMSVMKDRTASLAAGLVLPDEKLCLACHNAGSPTFKSFDFKTMFAKIAHPRPKP